MYSSLTHWWRKLLVISDPHRQQTILLCTKTGGIPKRIVNRVQSQVRPMVRGKARESIKVSTKVSISVLNGFAFLHQISWNQCNEGDDLMTKAKKYKQENGCYPERICANRIKLNTKDRDF